MKELSRIVEQEAKKLAKLSDGATELDAEQLGRLFLLAKCAKLLGNEEPPDEEPPDEDVEELKRRARG